MFGESFNVVDKIREVQAERRSRQLRQAIAEASSNSSTEQIHKAIENTQKSEDKLKAAIEAFDNSLPVVQEFMVRGFVEGISSQIDLGTASSFTELLRVLTLHGHVHVVNKQITDEIKYRYYPQVKFDTTYKCSGPGEIVVSDQKQKLTINANVFSTSPLTEQPPLTTEQIETYLQEAHDHFHQRATEATEALQKKKSLEATYIPEYNATVSKIEAFIESEISPDKPESIQLESIVYVTVHDLVRHLEETQFLKPILRQWDATNKLYEIVSEAGESKFIHLSPHDRKITFTAENPYPSSKDEDASDKNTKIRFPRGRWLRQKFNIWSEAPRHEVKPTEHRTYQPSPVSEDRPKYYPVEKKRRNLFRRFK